MSELFFSLKCLFFTVMLVIAMQFRIGGRTIESMSYEWLRYSKASMYIQSVASGGALAIKNLSGKVKEGLAGASESMSDSTEAQAHR